MMIVNVQSRGAFQRDVALVRRLDGVVVLSANEHDCYVLSDISDGKLWFEHHRDVKSHYENTGSDGGPWLSIRGIAYVSEVEMLADFGADEMDEAEEFYDSIRHPAAPATM